MDRFKNKETKKLFDGDAKGLPTEILIRAKSKLKYLYSATNLNDLKVPPSNHLEKLKGDRLGQYSIRINEKYRICFTWADNKASEIEFIDYH